MIFQMELKKLEKLKMMGKEILQLMFSILKKEKIYLLDFDCMYDDVNILK